MKKFEQGFTLMEILIVVVILLLLMMVVLLNLRGQSNRAQDSKRKSDLYTLRTFLEDYYNDYSAFPGQSTFDDYTCSSDDMAPYLSRVPCDPATKSHYGYFPSVNGGYRICAKLSDTTDPAIAAAGCGGAAGCGVGEGYNYCLASGVTASAVGTDDATYMGGGGTPTPKPTPVDLVPGYHVVCTRGGACNNYDDPEAHGCPVSWEEDCPGYIHYPDPEVLFSGACGISANRCAN